MARSMQTKAQSTHSRNLRSMPPPTPAPQSLTSIDQSSQRFRWEAEMTPIVTDTIDSLLWSSDAHLVVPEIPAAIGIVDLLAIRFDEEAVRLRLESGVGAIGSPLRIRTLDALRDGRWRRQESVARSVASNVKALRRSTIVPLAEQGLIELEDTSRGPRIRSTAQWLPIGQRITAVELKLSRWRKALRQGHQFARSADRSWVVLDQARARPAIENLESFRRLGVGLAVLDVDGRLRTITRPGRRRPQRWLRALIAERAWAEAGERRF